MAESIGDGATLQVLFTEGWEAQKSIEAGKMSAEEKKACVSKGIGALEKATHLANQLSLFSSNELVDEVTTADLKFLLLPALLGDLTLQLCEGERLEIIAKARVYCVDFLQRCKSYAITSEELPSSTGSIAEATPPPTTSRKSYEQMAAERSSKIARLKAQKEMEKKMEDLSEKLKSLSPDKHDDELIREHLLSLLKVWVFRCFDHVRSIDQEIELLEMMEKMRRGDVAKQPQAAPPPSRPPMKPIVITRETLKNKVFGAGYPSLPTVSLEEFYQQQYREQVEQQRSQAAVKKSRPPEEEEEELGGANKKEAEEDDEDSEEALKKARDFDDFKDENRRGWGNRKNMG